MPCINYLLRLFLFCYIFLSESCFAEDSIKNIRFFLMLSNNTGVSLKDQYVSFLVPFSGGEYQKLLDLKVGDFAGDVIHESYRTIVRIGPVDFSPYAKTVVPIYLSIKTIERTSGSIGVSSWLGSDKFMDLTDDELKRIAFSLSASNSAQTIDNIYNWVKDNVVYSGYVADSLGASYAVKYKRGDCTEYASLVVALARLNGIKARLAGGYVVDRDQVVYSKDYHNWSEIYLNGEWRIVDAQKGNFMEYEQDYITFFVYDSSKDYGFEYYNRYWVVGDLSVRF